MIAPLFVGRFKSINAIEAVMEENNISASEAIEFIKAGRHTRLYCP